MKKFLNFIKLLFDDVKDALFILALVLEVMSFGVILTYVLTHNINDNMPVLLFRICTFLFIGIGCIFISMILKPLYKKMSKYFKDRWELAEDIINPPQKMPVAEIAAVHREIIEEPQVSIPEPKIIQEPKEEKKNSRYDLLKA